MLNYLILGTLNKLPYCHVTFQLQISFKNCFFLHWLFSMFSECRYLSWFPYCLIVITKHRIKRTMFIKMKGNVNVFLLGLYLNIHHQTWDYHLALKTVSFAFWGHSLSAFKLCMYLCACIYQHRWQKYIKKNIQTHANIFWMKASAWLNERICKSGSFPPFCVDKDPVMTRGPGTEMKRNHQLLFSAFSLPVQDKQEIAKGSMMINILSMTTVFFLNCHLYDDFKAAETSCNLQIYT